LDSSLVEWIPEEIGNSNSSDAQLLLDSKSRLTVVKTSIKSNCAELIQREASILKTLKHPLILELRRILLIAGISIQQSPTVEMSFEWCKLNHTNYRWNCSWDAIYTFSINSKNEFSEMSTVCREN
jgi:hypothetical protein